MILLSCTRSYTIIMLRGCSFILISHYLYIYIMTILYTVGIGISLTLCMQYAYYYAEIRLCTRPFSLTLWNHYNYLNCLWVLNCLCCTFAYYKKTETTDNTVRGEGVALEDVVYPCVKNIWGMVNIYYFW